MLSTVKFLSHTTTQKYAHIYTVCQQVVITFKTYTFVKFQVHFVFNTSAFLRGNGAICSACEV